jgi:hypothetical protein
LEPCRKSARPAKEFRSRRTIEKAEICAAMPQMRAAVQQKLQLNRFIMPPP